MPTEWRCVLGREIFNGASYCRADIAAKWRDSFSVQLNKVQLCCEYKSVITKKKKKLRRLTKLEMQSDTKETTNKIQVH